ncbi:hypothetical protein [Actinomyces lilanjuaniae]|uniref:hypothetical protein n=1 Tax=Actinomyces lilanjuaniae TaxID=2321394 RepID=UPI0013C4CF59|nr:hypothetical protein [Actinomyces lilanjuaniae]
MSGGWSVCPLCGTVVADVAGHVFWHEHLMVEVMELVEAMTADDTDSYEEDL